MPSIPMNPPAAPEAPLQKVCAGGMHWLVRAEVPVASLQPALEKPDEFLSRREQQFKSTRTVTVARVPDFAPALPRLVMRRLNYGQLKHRLRDWLRPTRVRRAFEMGLRLEQLRITTPRVVAVTEKRRLGWPLAGYLITQEVPGARTLAQFMNQYRALPAATVRQLADLLAALHRQGFSHRDLKPGNVLIDDRERPWLIDLDGVRFYGVVSEERAQSDFIRLARGLAGYPDFLRTAGWNFLCSYGARRNCHPNKFAGAIAAAIETEGDWVALPGDEPELGNRDGRKAVGQASRLPPTESRPKGRIFTEGTPSVAGGTPAPLSFVRSKWQSAFAAANLRRAEDFFSVTGEALSKPGLGTRYRARLKLPRNDGQETVYLKRFGRENFSERLRRRFEQGRWLTPGEQEKRISESLRIAEIPVAEPLAWGWRNAEDGARHSFAVLAAVPGESLHQWAANPLPKSLLQKKQMTARVAKLARRFHEQGWRHRDLYLSHIFADHAVPAPRLSLIDLQRVFRPRWRRERWRVKDLAQLNYSAARFFSRSLRMYFFHRYLKVTRLDTVQKNLLRRVVRKTHSIARHARA